MWRSNNNEEFTRQVQQLESTIVVLQQRVEGQGIMKEPKISLPTKIDGSKVHFRAFLNQVRLVIQIHHVRYSTYASRVGLVVTLLTSITLSWFAPLLETNSLYETTLRNLSKNLRLASEIQMVLEQQSRRFVHYIKVINQHRHMRPIFVSSQVIFLRINKP